MLGVADAQLLPLMGEALLRLGCARALVVHGEDGVDELSLGAPTRICEVRSDAGNCANTPSHPANLGWPSGHARRCSAATPQQNAGVLRDVLAGKRDGAHRRHGGAQRRRRALRDWPRTLADGVGQAQTVLASGRAAATLDALVEASQAQAGAAD